MRKKFKYTQKQVADLLGLDRSTYAYYELGKIKPDISTIMRISDIFNVHYTAILESEDTKAFSDFRKNVVNQQLNISEKNLDITNFDFLTNKEQDVLMAFRLLSNEAQEDMMKFISQKLKNNKK